MPPPFSGDPNRLVTLASAAEELQVSVRTVRRFIGYGYVEAYRIGPRAIRLRAGDVNGLLHRLPGGYDGTRHTDDTDDTDDTEEDA